MVDAHVILKSTTMNNITNEELQSKLSRVKSTDTFVEEARALHGDLFDYNKVDYRSITQRVLISCKKHGDFYVMPREHLAGKGCTKCSREKEFVEKLHAKFGNKFGIEKLKYVDANTPVELVCPTHGYFVRKPSNILESTYGCPECYSQQVEESKLATEAKKEQRKQDAQMQYNLFYESLTDSIGCNGYDSYYDFIENIANILKQLDNRSLSDLMTLLRREQRERKYSSECYSSTGLLYQVEQLPTSFVSIDFETLYAQRVSACSIGLVKYKNGKLVDRYYSLIRPPFDYSGKRGSALTWIHGFSEQMLENEKTMAELLPEIEQFIERLPLVAHNACVEKACFRETIAYYGLESNIDYENILDTLTLSKQIERKIGNYTDGAGTHSLDAVCRRFGVPEMNHHNALDDAEMCGNLLLQFILIQKDGVTEIMPISDDLRTIKQSAEKYKAEDKIPRTDLENVCDNPFKEKVVVLTGFSKCDSQNYAHKLNELGAIIKDSVNKKTNILIAGYNAGPSKLQKAQEFGAQIMPESELIEILKSL